MNKQTNIKKIKQKRNGKIGKHYYQTNLIWKKFNILCKLKYVPKCIISTYIKIKFIAKAFPHEFPYDFLILILHITQTSLCV